MALNNSSIGDDVVLKKGVWNPRLSKWATKEDQAAFDFAVKRTDFKWNWKNGDRCYVNYEIDSPTPPYNKKQTVKWWGEIGLGGDVPKLPKTNAMAPDVQMEWCAEIGDDGEGKFMYVPSAEVPKPVLKPTPMFHNPLVTKRPRSQSQPKQAKYVLSQSRNVDEEKMFVAKSTRQRQAKMSKFQNILDGPLGLPGKKKKKKKNTLNLEGPLGLPGKTIQNKRARNKN